MLIEEFIEHLKRYRLSLDTHTEFHEESPKRMEFKLEQIIEFLSDFETEGTLKIRLETTIQGLTEAKANIGPFCQKWQAVQFSQTLDPMHPTVRFWIEQVIATAEAALDVTLDYLTGNE
jgi:hypothetical protein